MKKITNEYKIGDKVIYFDKASGINCETVIAAVSYDAKNNYIVEFEGTLDINKRYHYALYPRSFKIYK